jgi:hypothetical protein
MATQAAQLSNHYDVLGLSPTASQEEISAAFERALGNFARPLASTLHIYQAFEVLRQPDKRRAYDRSIGVAPEPRQTQFLIPSQARAPFTVAARASGGSSERQPEPAPPVEVAEPAVEPAPVIRFARPVPAPEPPVPASDPALDELVDSILAEGRAEKAALRNAERRPQDWRRLAIAAGALVVGAGIVGGVAGVSASGPAAEEAALDTPLPAPSPYLAGSTPSAKRATDIDAPVETANRGVAATPRRTINPLVIPPEVEAAMAARSRILPDAEENADAEAPPVTADPLAPEAATTATASSASANIEPARLPLPKAAIARTIQKIGYPCGGVSSVAAVDAGGVFKVTCSSGHSYRAAPVGGRYRFKKWSGA